MFFWRPHIYVEDLLFSLETPYFRWEPLYFHLIGDHQIFIRNPRFVLETHRFSLKTAFSFSFGSRFSVETPRIELETPQIFVGDKIMGSAMKIWGSRIKI